MPTTQTIYLYLLNTLSDWEIAYATTGINNHMLVKDQEAYQLKTFTVDGQPITTSGGLRVVPDISLSKVNLKNAAMLILPGGWTWDDGHEEALDLAKQFHAKGISVAAICGATLGLARAGLLDTVKHTSNSLEYIQTSNYKGSEHYSEEDSVTDKSITTAPGTAPLEFARDIIKKLDLYKPNVLQAWYNLYKVSSPDAFKELVKAVEG